MVASPDVDFWIKNRVLTYLCVDTGATGNFGTPTAESDPALFKNYLDALDDAAAAVTMMKTTTMTESSSAFKKGSSFSSSSTRLALSSTTNDNNNNKNNNPTSSATTSSTTTTTSSSSTNAFTVVLVDGRFRVACALKALWHLDHSRGVLLVHDWVGRADQYHAGILKRYELIAVVDRLAVLAPAAPAEEEEEEDDQARLRWWAEAAEEMEKYSRDAA